MKVPCVLITHLRAKVEMRRQPHLRDRTVLIVDRSRGRPLVIDYFPAASGVVAGMTLEKALSRQVNSAILEAEEATYRKVLRRMLVSLQGISDRVEGAGLGTAYVRLDGLEALYGGEARLATTLQAGQGESHRRRRMHQPDAGAHRRGQQAEQSLERESLRSGGVGDGVLMTCTGSHRLGRQVIGIDGLNPVVAAPENREDREAPQCPRYVVEQQVPRAKGQGRPVDCIGETTAFE